ncbi:uncharacterized [Tachysurus ichikawai]
MHLPTPQQPWTWSHLPPLSKIFPSHHSTIIINQPRSPDRFTHSLHQSSVTCFYTSESQKTSLETEEHSLHHGSGQASLGVMVSQTPGFHLQTNRLVPHKFLSRRRTGAEFPLTVAPVSLTNTPAVDQ